MTKYLYKACFTDYIRCKCESIFTVRELRQFCGDAFSLRESRPDYIPLDLVLKDLMSKDRFYLT